MRKKKLRPFEDNEENEKVVSKKVRGPRRRIDEKNQNIAAKLFEVYENMPRKKGDQPWSVKPDNKLMQSIRIKQQMNGFFKAAIRAHHLNDAQSFNEISKRVRRGVRVGESNAAEIQRVETR